MESHLESQSIDIGKRSHCDGWLNDSLKKIYIYPLLSLDVSIPKDKINIML